MRARRRAVIAAILAGLTPLGREALAQAVRPPRRVAVLFSGGREQYYEDFKAELRLRGYNEYQNLVLLPKWAMGESNRLAGLVEELLRFEPEVIVTSSTAATVAVQRTGTKIPVVMATSADPVRSGFVASLARPGGNITGMASLSVQLSIDTVDLLREVVPKARRYAVLLTRNSAYDAQMPEILAAAKKSGITIVTGRANSDGELEEVFAEFNKDGIEALVVFGDAVFVRLRRKLAALTRRYRIPAIYQWRSHAEAGGLMSYGPKISQGWKVAARYVDRILKGADPAATPVEQVTIFELIINTATARALKLDVPKPILQRADALIE